MNSEKVGGKYRVTVRLTILLKALCDDLQQNNMVLNPTWTDSKAVKATASLNPTIVIVPDMIDGSDLATLRQKVVEDPVLKYAVRKLTDEFNRHGYTTQDAFNILQNQINSAMMNTGNQTDIATEIMKRMPGDIVVNVDAKVLQEGNESECICNETLYILIQSTIVKHIITVKIRLSLLFFGIYFLLQPTQHPNHKSVFNRPHLNRELRPQIPHLKNIFPSLSAF